MKTRKLFFAVMAMAASIMISACGGSKNVASRGVKQQKEECQQKWRQN